MSAKELIRRKRDGGTLSRAELAQIATDIASGAMTDAQTAAFAMAVFFRGLDSTELPAWTAAMRDSGTVLNWDDIEQPVLDKHSTGGVGDKVSLLLAPLVAACGGAVPMLSGRGLGHTGGTLDKLEAIPGYDATPDGPKLRRAVKAAGCAIAGQTADLAPADRKLYAIRDATGSVESMPLIVSSILSKKLAAGLQGLVLDVKHGSGAFLPEYDRAKELAQALVDAANAEGLPAKALLTDMDQVLGSTAGNALEVVESVAALMRPDDADPRLIEVTLALTRTLLALGGIDADPEEPLRDGRGAECFARMVTTLGGPSDLLERLDDHLPKAPVVQAIHAQRAGIVTRHDTRELGLVVLELGGGRKVDGAAIDHAVGLSAIAAVGTQVTADRPLAVVHARDAAQAEQAAAAVRQAMVVGDTAPAPRPTVNEEISPR